jgi:hypothetical protein
VTKPTTPYDSVREWARYWLGGEDDTAVSNHGTLRTSLMYEVMVPAAEDDLPPFQLPDSSPACYDDEKGATLLVRACAGDADADAVLCEVACQYLLYDMPLPPNLGGYIAVVLRGRFTARPRLGRGRSPYTNVRRNFFIYGAVAHLRAAGFHPTRNRVARESGTAPESGCAIVARALTSAMPHIGDYVFTLKGDKPVSSWGRAERSLDDAAGVTGWRIHYLRRTVATGMQKLGVSLQTVEAVLGHTSGSRDGIVGVYQRHDYAAEKISALEAWGAHVMSVVRS